MKKQLLILLLACVASISASAYDFEVDGICYKKNGSAATATVTSGTRYSGEVIIPSTVTYDGTTYSVTSIGEGAFDGCTGLTSVSIPNSVTSIGYIAFQYCSGLTSVTIPNSVIKIGDFAFTDCSSLTELTIGNSVTSISYRAFAGCSSLTSVTIPDSVISISDAAFSDCSSLTAFYGKYASSDNRCLIKYGWLISFAPNGLTSYSIPDSVTSIGMKAFENCDGLTSVTIPNSVTSIGLAAFANCSGLTSVTIPESVTSIRDYAFYHCSSLTAFYGKYTSSDNRCLIIDGTLNSFAPNGLTTYSIPDSVTSIGESAFDYCAGLTSVTIPNSVTKIGVDAFYGCSNLTSVTIGNSVTKIDEHAFARCSSLTSVTIPNSVTSIRDLAFQECTGLTSVRVENDNPTNISLGYGVFYGVPTSTCILYVPAGSVDLYAAAYQWKDFYTIKEIAASGIDEVIMDGDAGADAPYYDLMGRRVVNPSRGIYIHCGRKVLVK